MLMRHANAPSGQPDLYRTLSDHGRDDAQRIGAWAASQGWKPNHIVTSPASRCQETAQIMASFTDAPITEVAELYEAQAERYRPFLQDGVLIVGHDPAITDAILMLGGQFEPDAHGRFVTPGTVACIEDGRVVALWRPEELASA